MARPGGGAGGVGSAPQAGGQVPLPEVKAGREVAFYRKVVEWAGKPRWLEVVTVRGTLQIAHGHRVRAAAVLPHRRAVREEVFRQPHLPPRGAELRGAGRRPTRGRLGRARLRDARRAHACTVRGRVGGHGALGAGHRGLPALRHPDPAAASSSAATRISGRWPRASRCASACGWATGSCARAWGRARCRRISRSGTGRSRPNASTARLPAGVRSARATSRSRSGWRCSAPQSSATAWSWPWARGAATRGSRSPACRRSCSALGEHSAFDPPRLVGTDRSKSIDTKLYPVRRSRVGAHHRRDRRRERGGPHRGEPEVREHRGGSGAHPRPGRGVGAAE